MLALATLPSPVRAVYLRTNVKLHPKLDARMRAIATLNQAPRSAWKRTAQQLSAALAPRFGRGFSAKNLLTLFRDYRERGPDALMLGYGSESEKPAEFVNELARRCEKNNRVASVELDAIRAEWLAGADIPGYGNWRELWREKYEGEAEPEQCPDWFFPEGFSPRNLRRYLPGEAAMTLARDGFFAAHKLMPQKKNDYSQLLPLQFVVFDDVKTDWLVHFPGCRVPCELWLLVAMDVATRTILDWVALAAVPDEDGKRPGLLLQHMKILGGSLLTRYGIPTEYKMTWLVENATATYKDDAILALQTLSGGQIVVKKTKMGRHELPGGHTEVHGTPWDMKGVLESFFRTFHDHGAALPGQTGSIQMLNAPADLDQKQADHKALMNECEDLAPAVIEQLKLEFLRYSEAIAALEKLFSHLNRRTKHRLQGFARIDLWRFPDDASGANWRPIDELRRYPAADVRRAIFSHRMETPLERLEKLLRLQPPFAQVPPEAILPFSARLIKKVRHPAPYTIAWTEQGTVFTYRGEVPELARGNGGPFFVKLLPGDMTVAYLHDADTGALLGTLAHVTTPRVGDEAAQDAALGELAHYKSLVVKPVMERHAPDRAERKQNRDLNAAIVAAARSGTELVAAAIETKAASRKQSAATQKQNARRGAQLASAARQQIDETL